MNVGYMREVFEYKYEYMDSEDVAVLLGFLIVMVDMLERFRLRSAVIALEDYPKMKLLELAGYSVSIEYEFSGEPVTWTAEFSGGQDSMGFLWARISPQILSQRVHESKGLAPEEGLPTVDLPF